jgi:hypothetical protein
LAGCLLEKAEKGYPDLRHSALTDVLTEIVKGMDSDVEPIEESLWWLHANLAVPNIPQSCGSLRSKTYRNAEVYVFASESERDAREVLGSSRVHPHSSGGKN